MNEHDADFRATVVSSPTGGVSVTTTGVTIYPARFNVRIPQGRNWSLYVSWTFSDSPMTLTSYTGQFVARTVQGGTALLDITATMGTDYATIARTAAQTAALSFTRGWYNFNVTLGGTVTPLLEGFVDLDKSVMV
jgi:hypothetical protein